MKKLFVGFSFAAMALLAACGGDSGSSADNLDESSSSVEMEGIESSDSEDLNTNGSEGSEGESSGSEDAESSGSGEDSSASIPGGSSDGSIYDATANTLTDLRDGQVYKTTTINIPAEDYSEVWMAENLNYKTANSWCGGGNEMIEGDCSVYGRLYTWAAAVGMSEAVCGFGSSCDFGADDIRGVCPKGWHLPSKIEWEALFIAVGGQSVAGKMLKSQMGWMYSGNGIDTFGFSALPAGSRDFDRLYYEEGYTAIIWSSTEYRSTEFGSNSACNVWLGYKFDYARLESYSKDLGHSVRCLRD